MTGQAGERVTDEKGRAVGLLLVDLQNDYFADDELQRCLDDLVAACNRLVRAARETGVPVLEVRTVHEEDRSTWTMSMVEDDSGITLRGSAGADPVPGLEVASSPGEVEVVEKTRDSAFFGTDLADRLRAHGVGHLVVAGVSTESCILATAADAFAHDVAVTFVEDATASVSWDLHDRTLAQLQHQYRQDVRTSRDVVASWQAGGHGE